MCRRPDRDLYIRHQRVHSKDLNRDSQFARWRIVQPPAGPFLVNQFSSVPAPQVAHREHDHLFARASDAQCIRHGKVDLDNVPSASVQGFHHQVQRVRAAVQVRLPVVPVSVMFLAE